MSTKEVRAISGTSSLMDLMPKETHAMTKLNSQISDLVQGFILSTPELLATFDGSNYSFDLRFRENRLEILTSSSIVWIDPLTIQGLNDEQLRTLQKVEKLFANYIQKGLISDHCINGSEVYLPGISSLPTLPKAILLSFREMKKASVTGDVDGFKEALYKFVVQILATGGSLFLLADFIQKVITHFLPALLPAAFGAAMALGGSIVALVVCGLEMVRELLWMKFSSDAIKDLDTKTIEELREMMDLFEDKIEKNEPITVREFQHLQSLFAHTTLTLRDSQVFNEEEFSSLFDDLKQLQTAIDSNCNQYDPETAIGIYRTAFKASKHMREMFIRKEFEKITDDMGNKKVLQKRSRQFGANLTSQLALNEANIKADFDSRDEAIREKAFEQGATFLTEAKKQAIKKIVLYSLGILVCVLTALMFVIPGFNVMIALFAASLVVFCFTTLLFYERFVERYGEVITPLASDEEVFRVYRHQYLTAHHTELETEEEDE